MSLDFASFTDEDKERITNRMRELAKFDSGDRVTVEPAEHDVPYFGDELEGVPLLVADVFWNGNSLAPAPDPDDDRFRPADPKGHYGEDHFVTLSGDYEYYIHDRVLITRIEYTFKGDGAPQMSESALIPWNEYREEHDRIYQLTKSDNERSWLQPAEDGDECEVCGCNLMRHWFWSDRAGNTAGGHECPACGDVKEQHGP